MHFTCFKDRLCSIPFVSFKHVVEGGVGLPPRLLTMANSCVAIITKMKYVFVSFFFLQGSLLGSVGSCSEGWCWGLVCRLCLFAQALTTHLTSSLQCCLMYILTNGAYHRICFTNRQAASTDKKEDLSEKVYVRSMLKGLFWWCYFFVVFLYFLFCLILFCFPYAVLFFFIDLSIFVFIFYILLLSYGFTLQILFYLWILTNIIVNILT